MINWDAFNYDRRNKVFWIEDSEVTQESKAILKNIGYLDGDIWKIDRSKLGFELLTEAELFKELETRFLAFMFYGVKISNSEFVRINSGYPLLLKGMRAFLEEQEAEEDEDDSD